MRDYSAAALVFEDVLDKVVGVERSHYYGGLVRLAKGYGAWDVADYDAALEHLSAAKRLLGVAQPPRGEPAVPRAAATEGSRPPFPGESGGYGRECQKADRRPKAL